MKILIWCSLLLSLSAYSSEFSFEFGQTQTVNNYFQKPNNAANRVDLPRDNAVNIRARAFWTLNDKYDLYALIAPLEVTYNFQSKKNFNFDGTNFQSNQDTKVKYKFNSYRIGFLRKWKTQNAKLWAGLVAKIRDARILVAQNGLTEGNSNVGFVPLIAIGAEITLLKQLTIFTHIDALGASQGYAYDAQMELRYWFLESAKTENKQALALGFRSLGGGADNDTLKNFSQFNTLYASYTYRL